VTAAAEEVGAMTSLLARPETYFGTRFKGGRCATRIRLIRKTCRKFYMRWRRNPSLHSGPAPNGFTPVEQLSTGASVSRVTQRRIVETRPFYGVLNFRLAVSPSNFVFPGGRFGVAPAISSTLAQGPTASTFQLYSLAAGSPRPWSARSGILAVVAAVMT